MDDVITGDPVLAEMMKGQPAPIERIARVDYLLTVLNKLPPGKRVVELECGHRIKTRNRKRAKCPECHRMILNGEDYQRFRHGSSE